MSSGTIPKPWKLELVWAKTSGDFGTRRVRSYETERSRDAAVAEAQCDGWKVVRAWKAG